MGQSRIKFRYWILTTIDWPNMWRSMFVIVFAVAAEMQVASAPVYPHIGSTRYTTSDPHETRHTPAPYLEVRNATYHGSGPREEARAMCSVKTQEVNATANATITRRLHGVVTSSSYMLYTNLTVTAKCQPSREKCDANLRELHTSIQRLEVIIFGQMQQLWQSLDALRVQLAGNPRTASYPDRHTVAFRYTPQVFHNP